MLAHKAISLDETLEKIRQHTDKMLRNESVDIRTSKELLYDYLLTSDNLLYSDEFNYVLEASATLMRHILVYSKFASPVYADLNPKDLTKIYTKADFKETKSWAVEDIQYINTSTSGTTATKFPYRLWSEVYDYIEGNRHYGVVLKEFGLPQHNLRILHVQPGSFAKNYKLINRYFEF